MTDHIKVDPTLDWDVRDFVGETLPPPPSEALALAPNTQDAMRFVWAAVRSAQAVKILNKYGIINRAQTRNSEMSDLHDNPHDAWMDAAIRLGFEAKPEAPAVLDDFEELSIFPPLAAPVPDWDEVVNSIQNTEYAVNHIHAHMQALTEGERRSLFRAVIDLDRAAWNAVQKAKAPSQYESALQELAEKLAELCGEPLPDTAGPGYAMGLAIKRIKMNNAVAFLDARSKHCPNCDSTQITTTNNEWPLRHKCLDCKHEFEEAQKAKGGSVEQPATFVSVWSEWEAYKNAIHATGIGGKDCTTWLTEQLVIARNEKAKGGTE